MTKMLWLLQACLANYIHNNKGLYVTEDLTYSPSNPPESFSYKFLNLAENKLAGQVPAGALVTADLEALQINPTTQGVEKMKLRVRNDHRNRNLDVEKIKSLKVSKELERKIKFYKIGVPKTDIVRFVHTLNGKGEPKKCLIWGVKGLALGDCNDARSYLRFQEENGLSAEEIKKLKDTATKAEDSSDLSDQTKDNSSDEALKNKENKAPKIQPATTNTVPKEQQINRIFADMLEAYFENGFNSKQSALAQKIPSRFNIPSYETSLKPPQSDPKAAIQQSNVLSTANPNTFKTQQNPLNNANPNTLNTLQNPLNNANTLNTLQNPLNNANVLNALLHSLNPNILNSANVLNALLYSLNPNNLNNIDSLLMFLLLENAFKNNNKDSNESLLLAELMRQLFGNNNNGIGFNQLLAFSLLKKGQEKDTSYPHENLHSIAEDVSRLKTDKTIKESFDSAKKEAKEYTDKRFTEQNKNSKTSKNKENKPKTSFLSGLGPLGDVAKLTPQGQILDKVTQAADAG